MNAEILCVGTELLIGHVQNTNATYISRKLNDIGINVYYHSVVGDNRNRFKEVFKNSISRSRIIILTGGLGPTDDDLTKETIGEFLNKKMVLHKESLENIERYFKRLNRKMPEKNRKQAYFPEESIILKNDKGTAPGCIVESEDKIIVLLPGPPYEMKPMFENHVIPYLKKKSDNIIFSKFIRIFGVGEGQVEEKIIDLIRNQSNPTIAPYIKLEEVILRITAKAKSQEKCEKLIQPICTEIQKRLGNVVYSMENENLEQVVGRMLIENNISVALAESCTGGLLAAKITDIPGISKVFNRGLITYSNESKIEELEVNQETLQKYGAVSKETALEMAINVRNIAKTDIGVSITGIAGPGGGTEQKPVGLVYIALASEKLNVCKEYKLSGDRDKIRHVTVLNALDLVRRTLETS